MRAHQHAPLGDYDECPVCAEGEYEEHRLRVGVSRWPDGWNVVVEVDGKRSVYDPTYATETECQAKADEVSVLLRKTMGLPPRPQGASGRRGA